MESNVYPRQRLLQTQLLVVRDLFTRYQLDPNELDRMTPLIAEFRIRFPLIGAFSSGKTSLINAMIGESLLSVDITPETALPTELHAAPERRFIGHTSDGRTLTINEETVRANALKMLQPGGCLEVGLPHQLLTAHPHIIVVDLPGWDSGIEAHECVIDAYAERSLAYGVVVSADEGDLRQSLRRALLELAIQDIPVALIITKADKRPPEDLAAVRDKVQASLTELMGRAPLAVVITSARNKDTAGFAHILAELETRAEDIFEARIVVSFRAQIEHARTHLVLRANKEFHDAAKLQTELDALTAQLQVFDQQLERETASLDERVGPILGTIRLRVEQALSNRIDSLTERALSGGDISDDILGTARLIIAEAMRQEFEPAMHRYLERLEDALPSRLDLNINLKLDGKKQGNDNPGEFRWKALSTTLAPVLLIIPHPIGKILASVLPILAALFDGASQAKRQEIEEARQRERTSSKIRQALGDAVKQIETQLRPALHEQVQRAKTEVASSIAQERAEIERTFTALKANLEQGEDQAAQARTQAQADLQGIDALLQELTIQQKK